MNCAKIATPKTQRSLYLYVMFSHVPPGQTSVLVEPYGHGDGDHVEFEFYTAQQSLVFT